MPIVAGNCFLVGRARPPQTFLKIRLIYTILQIVNLTKDNPMKNGSRGIV